jgi:hypothetical protein
MKARPSTTNAKWGKPRAADDHIGFGVDSYTSEVMQAKWRNNSLCALIDSYDRCGERERQVLCAACPVSDPCFWAALVEERAFRGTSTKPPGVRGGVEGTRRLFILGELTDQELMVRYRQSVKGLTSELALTSSATATTDESERHAA